MRRIYFYLPEFPEAPTGGIKYHNIVYNYVKERREGVYLAGNGKFSKLGNRNKLFKIMHGLFVSCKVKRKSIIVLSNTAFLHFMIPMILNRIFKKHYYFMIVHHLVRNENPEFFRTKFEEFFIRHSDFVMTVSNATKNDLQEHSLLKSYNIPVVPPGLDAIFSPINRKTDTNGDNIVKLLYIGTIEKRKGLIHLIEAFRYLDKEKFILNIIGGTQNSDDYFKSLMMKISELDLADIIFFRGRVCDVELQEYYRSSSLFVFPSLWEGYGMVAAEAMSHALPVVASNIPSLREIVDDGSNGYLVEPANPRALAEKIRILAEDRDRIERFSDSAYRKSNSFRSWDKVGSEIADIINRIS